MELDPDVLRSNRADAVGLADHHTGMNTNECPFKPFQRFDYPNDLFGCKYIHVPILTRDHMVVNKNLQGIDIISGPSTQQKEETLSDLLFGLRCAP